MKYVSAAEFKAKCLKLMDEVQAGGEPITVTKRGKPVVKIEAARAGATREPGLATLLGSMRGTVTVMGDWDETEPVDPDWEVEWEAKWDEHGFAVPKDTA